jgi:hypothetical protein
VACIPRHYDLTHTEIGEMAISAAFLKGVIGSFLLAGSSAYAAVRFSGAQMALQIGGPVLFVVVLVFFLHVFFT